jgi:hypothetical protein
MGQVNGGGGFADATFRHCNGNFTHDFRRPPSSCVEFFYYTVLLGSATPFNHPDPSLRPCIQAAARWGATHAKRALNIDMV